MKCEFCGAEWEEGTLCPACGKEAAAQEEVTPAEETPVVEQTPAAEEPAEEAPAEELSDAEEPAEEAPAEEPAEKEAPAMKPGIQMTPGKLAVIIAAAVVLLAALVALIVWGVGSQNSADPTNAPTNAPTEASGETVAATEATIPADTGLDDVTHKGTYTVDGAAAAAAAATVVATMDGAELDNGTLQVFYWMQYYDLLEYYGSSIMYYGLDYTKPLDSQVSPSGNTWQQYLLGLGLESWNTYQALTLEAEANGYTLTQEQQDYLDKLETSLNESAKEYGFASGAEMLQADMGPGVTLDGYREYLRLNYLGYSYFASEGEKRLPTEDEILQYYNDHAEEYAAQGIDKTTELTTVRHVLLRPEGCTQDPTTGVITATDEAWADLQKQAQAMLDKWVSEGATEEGFAQLAIDNSVDGSASNGGLIENFVQGDMVENFDAWCFEEGRKTGDYGLVRTEFGYHLMYYVGTEFEWHITAQADAINALVEELMTQTVEKHPMKVDYSAIVLGLPEESQ